MCLIDINALAYNIVTHSVFIVLFLPFLLRNRKVGDKLK